MQRAIATLALGAAAFTSTAHADTPVGTTLYKVGAGKIEGDLLADTVRTVTVAGSVITVVSRDENAAERTLDIDVAALAGAGSAGATTPDDFEAAAFAQLFTLAPEDYEAKTVGATGAWQVVGHGTLEAHGFGALDVSGYDPVAIDYDDQRALPASAAGFAPSVGNHRVIELERDGVPALAVKIGRTRSNPPEILVSFPVAGTYHARLRDLARRADPAPVTDVTLTGAGTAASPLGVATPLTSAEVAKLAGVEAGATADQTPAEIRNALSGLSGAARLPASAVKDLPSGGGGLSTVAHDGTLTGTGAAGSPLAVAAPFTAADEAKLDGVEAGATADQTPAEIRNALAGLSGAARLPASAVKDLPSGGGGLSTVAHDGTLTGTGAAGSPLAVAAPFNAPALEGIGYRRTDERTEVFAAFGGDAWQLPDGATAGTHPFVATTYSTVASPANPATSFSFALRNEQAPNYGGDYAVIRVPSALQASLGDFRTAGTDGGVSVVNGADWAHVEDVAGYGYYTARLAVKAADDDMWVERFSPFEIDKHHIANAWADWADAGDAEVIPIAKLPADRFTAADEAKLDGIEAGATGDQTAGELRDALAGLSGAARLGAAAIKGLSGVPIPASPADDGKILTAGDGAFSWQNPLGFHSRVVDAAGTGLTVTNTSQTHYGGDIDLSFDLDDSGHSTGEFLVEATLSFATRSDSDIKFGSATIRTDAARISGLVFASEVKRSTVYAAGQTNGVHVGSVDVRESTTKIGEIRLALVRDAANAVGYQFSYHGQASAGENFSFSPRMRVYFSATDPGA